MSNASPVQDPELPEPPRLKFLRRLVVVLTTTMILGLITIVALIVMTFLRTNEQPVTLSQEIELPAGHSALAFTKGTDWNAIVTRDEAGAERILIIDPASGTIRQTIDIKSALD